MKSKLFLISGPSGAGEDSVIKGLKKTLPLEKAITTTTREKRPGEKNGREYYFVSKQNFLKKIKNNNFFEYAETDRGNFYGNTKEEIDRILASGNIPVLKIDFKGVITIKKRTKKAVAIYIYCPLKDLEKRIRDRSKVTDEFIKARLEYAKGWEENKKIFDYIVKNENGKLDKAIEKTKKIIQKELK